MQCFLQQLGRVHLPQPCACDVHAEAARGAEEGGGGDEGRDEGTWGVGRGGAGEGHDESSEGGGEGGEKMRGGGGEEERGEGRGMEVLELSVTSLGSL